MAAEFGDEVPMHLEFVRFGGEIACFGLQLVRYTTRRAAARDHRRITTAAAARSSIRTNTRSKAAG